MLITIPEVDTLNVTVVVDSYFDNLAQDVECEGLTVKRGHGLLQGQHGLSLYLESEQNGETEVALLDFAMTKDTLSKNMRLLGIDGAEIRSLILSHGHLDHFGGLSDYLDEASQETKSAIKLHVGGDEVFCQRWHVSSEGEKKKYGTLDPAALKALGVDIVVSEEPSVMFGHAFSTGLIPRSSFEHHQKNTHLTLDETTCPQCDLQKLKARYSDDELKNKLLPDYHWSEHATVYNLKGRGLVVITSCGHAGIINTIRQAQAASGIQEVFAVMGGFHLSPEDKGYVHKVVTALRDEVDPTYIIPMHCTGATFAHIVAHEMPEKLIMSYVGSAFNFASKI